MTGGIFNFELERGDTSLSKAFANSTLGLRPKVISFFLIIFLDF
jgi:hypothetical protein